MKNLYQQEFIIPSHYTPQNLTYPMIHCQIQQDVQKNVLSLPMDPYLTEEEIVYICSSLKDFLDRK